MIEFDIPAYVPPNATITGAVLTLYLGQVAGSGGSSGADPTPRTIRLYEATTAWAGTTNGTTGFPGPGFGEIGQGFPANIGDATWNDAKFNRVPWKGAGGGGDFNSLESGDILVGQSVNTAYSWGSTTQMVSDVQNWLDGASPNDGWLLKNDSEALPTTFRAFYTREGAVEQGLPQFVPDLLVSYVVPAPEPPILATIVLSALTITALKRRQRSALGSATGINPDCANRAWPSGERT